MQIKKQLRIQNRPVHDLVWQWFISIRLLIAGVLIFPYLFLFLGKLYGEEFHTLPNAVWPLLILIQVALVILILLISLLILIQKISQDMQRLSELLALQIDQPDAKIMQCDDWLTIEKRTDPIGRIAIVLRRWMAVNQNPAGKKDEFIEQCLINQQALQGDWNTQAWFPIKGNQIDSPCVSSTLS
jgi:hypothetical protein